MRYLGVDYGLKKIGLAISEGQLSSIYQVLEIDGLEDALEKVKRIIDKEKIDRVVIGKPEGKMGENVDKFIKLLKKDIVVIETEETLSSVNAKKLMVDLNLSRKERQKEDAYAAALILQNFLDSLN